MLEELIAGLIGRRGSEVEDVLSLLRLLGPIAGGGSLGLPQSRSAISNLGFPLPGIAGLPVMGTSFGLAGAVVGLLGSLWGRDREEETVPKPLPIYRYESPAARNEELGLNSLGTLREVVRANEFARSEVQEVVESPRREVSAAATTLDGRMFLQHSDEIAQAVRQALLYSHPLSELLRE